MKRLKNVENKNKEQLTKVKDQGQKQLKILVSKMNKEVDFKKISFKNKLNFGLTKLYNDIKKIDYTKPVCIGSGKHHYDFTIFMGLGNFGENIYYDNFPLKKFKK